MRKNPGVEAGIGGGGWWVGVSDILLIVVAGIAIAGLISGERAGAAGLAAQKANPTPENLYLGYSELTPAQKAAVMAVSEDQRQNLVNQFLSKSKVASSGFSVDPSLMKVASIQGFSPARFI